MYLGLIVMMQSPIASQQRSYGLNLLVHLFLKLAINVLNGIAYNVLTLLMYITGKSYKRPAWIFLAGF